MYGPSRVSHGVLKLQKAPTLPHTAAWFDLRAPNCTLTFEGKKLHLLQTVTSEWVMLKIFFIYLYIYLVLLLSGWQLLLATCDVSSSVLWSRWIQDNGCTHITGQRNLRHCFPASCVMCSSARDKHKLHVVQVPKVHNVLVDAVSLWWWHVQWHLGIWNINACHVRKRTFLTCTSLQISKGEKSDLLQQTLVISRKCSEKQPHNTVYLWANVIII